MEPTSSRGDVMVEGGEFYILILIRVRTDQLHLPLPLEGGRAHQSDVPTSGENGNRCPTERFILMDLVYVLSFNFF